MGLFNYNNPVIVFMVRVANMIIVSLYWILCCIPVVTVGASFAALYDASYRTFRKNERNSWQRFFAVFRDNWKAGILPTLIFLLAGWGLIKGVIALWNLAVAGTMSWMLFSALAFVAGGMNVVYQIEQVPLMVAIFIHGGVLYVGYLITYLVNGWLEWGTTPILVFTAIFVLCYLIIWAIIYCCSKRTTDKVNEALQYKQKNNL